MAGMFAAMALTPVASQVLSTLLFVNQAGGHRFPTTLPGNSRMIGLPNHLPANVYLQAGGRRRRLRPRPRPRRRRY